MVASKMLSVKEIADTLNVAEMTVRRLIASGRLSHCRIGDRILCTQRQLDEFIEASTVRNKVAVGA